MIGVIVAVLIIAVGFGIKKQYFSSEKEVKEFTYGPFVIRMERFTTSDFNMNYGKFVKRQNIDYSVWHHGKLVEFPAKLQSNTGFSHLWRVYILKDAPVPTLIAGSQSVFMITAKDNTYEVKPLEVQSSDFIKFQWLDAINGHPDDAFELFMGDERTSMEHPDTLQGGKYLMINQKLVIDVPGMEMYYFNKDSRYVDNYDKDGDALSFSPDNKVIAFPGHFQTWNSNETPTYENALVTYDFRKDGIKVLPNSKNETRLYKVEDMNIDWFNTNFMWETTNGETILQFRKPKKPYIWQGYFRDDFYYIFPTDEAMLLIFKQFVLDYMKWTSKEVLSEKYHEYTGRVYQLGKDKSVFHLAGKENEVIFSDDLYGESDDSIHTLVKDIGNAFNEVLKTGKYKEHNTAIPEVETY
ncbi:MAG: hypothetical protein H7X99_05900 [Saprospiraceae bacterium]|nr:hypothetical protein [Saprospiraceae bacterium]